MVIVATNTNKNGVFLDIGFDLCIIDFFELFSEVIVKNYIFNSVIIENLNQYLVKIC